MNLEVFWIDMRGGYRSAASYRSKVIDNDTGKLVGYIDNQRSPINRRISLFNGKYQAEFETKEECQAFADGVSAVLNAITSNLVPGYALSGVDPVADDFGKSTGTHG